MTTYHERTGLLVVDVQNDFADPSGSLSVDDGDVIVPRANQEIAEARAAGGLVVYTQDWHPPVTKHFFKDGGIWPEHCVQDTWGAEFHPDLVLDGEIVRKGADGRDGYSGFSVLPSFKVQMRVISASPFRSSPTMVSLPMVYCAPGSM